MDISSQIDQIMLKRMRSGRMFRNTDDCIQLGKFREMHTVEGADCV